MVKQPSWSCNEQVDTLDELVCLGLAIGTANDDTKCVVMISEEVARNAKDLQRQLACW